MMIRKLFTILIATGICFSSCAGRGEAGASAISDSGNQPKDTATYQLPLPKVPASIKEPAKRAAFVADHYWDHMDWQDTLLLSSERFMGESMATYGELLRLSGSERTRSSAVNAMVNSAAVNPKALKTVSDYAYTYFYYPDAPQYDPELYLDFITPLMAQPGISRADKMRLERYRKQILNNRVGSVARDFVYIGEDGKQHRLLSTAQGAQYRVIFFFDPDCNICEEAIEMMKSSKKFSEAEKEGVAAVIAINPFGQESPGKAKGKSTMPDNWTVGYSPDGEVDNDELYSIRATPAIYVIDQTGRILEKDLSLARLDTFLNPQ